MYSKGIVKYRREGTTLYYSIASEFIHQILDSISECQEKVHSGEWELDLVKLEQSDYQTLQTSNPNSLPCQLIET